jgi:hypothetical protein
MLQELDKIDQEVLKELDLEIELLSASSSKMRSQNSGSIVIKNYDELIPAKTKKKFLDDLNGKEISFTIGGWGFLAKERFFDNLNPKIAVLHAKFGRTRIQNPKFNKREKKSVTPRNLRQGKAELSDFRKSYLDKLNRFLGILNEVSDFSSIGLLKTCNERGLVIHSHSDLTRHINDLSDLGAVKIMSVSNSPRKLEILKKSLIN